MAKPMLPVAPVMMHCFPASDKMPMFLPGSLGCKCEVAFSLLSIAAGR